MKTEDRNIDVSIIVPVYNHENYVKQALTSIIEQETIYTYEILVGEDASPDGSKDVIRKFEKENPGKIYPFYREKNLGATKNGYALYMKARGRYIIVLEGDDYWSDKNKIQKQVRFLDEHPEYIGVASNFSKVDKNNIVLEAECIHQGRVNRAFTWSDFLEYGFEFQTATLMYHNIYLDGGDYSILYKAHEMVGDLTVLTILLNRGNIYVMGDVMSAYRYVVDKSLTNACSVSSKDPALSLIKTVRQYVLLKPFLTNKSDFDLQISEKKTDFLIKMIKGREGYTRNRWEKLIRMGNWKTNLCIVPMFFKICMEKVTSKVKKEKR